MSTIIQQGRFTSNGAARQLAIRSDVDRIRVFNETAAAQAAADLGVEFIWMRGMAAGRGWFYQKLGTVANDPVTVGQIAANAGFTLLNTSLATVGAASTVTNISGATPPRVTAAAHGLQTGNIVRMYSLTGAAQLGGIDFEVTRFDANNFDLRFMQAVAAAAAPGAGARVRRVNFDSIYTPRRRFITRISQAAQAIVTMSVTHNFTVGQEVRFVVPYARYGMTEIDDLQGTVTAINAADADGYTNTITVDIDTTGFTAFTFPTSANVVADGSAFTPAQVVPVGADTSVALANNIDPLLDNIDNQSILGIELAAGANSPAGQNNDVIYYEALKSFLVDNN